MLAPVPNDAVLSLSWPCIIVAIKIVGVADASYFILFYSVAIINPLAFNVQYVHMYNVYLGFKKMIEFYINMHKYTPWLSINHICCIYFVDNLLPTQL